MNASEYKKQFLAFLLSAYPDGLPTDFDNLIFNVGDDSFMFAVDVKDFYQAGGQILEDIPEPPRKRRVTRNTKRGGRKAPLKKKFESYLSDKDIELLKGMRISLDE